MQSVEPLTHAQAVRALIAELAGNQEVGALELLRTVHQIDIMYQNAVSDYLHETDLSGPRLGILLHLWAEERRNGRHGVSPTFLSRCQNVSKNTVSTLLRGLEEQGLIERMIDPSDRRIFRICLSVAGKELVRNTAPGFLSYIDTLVNRLPPTEQVELTELLTKLRRSLMAHVRPGLTEFPHRELAGQGGL